MNAAISIALVVAEAIRELGEVPSGHLYAHLMAPPLNLTEGSYNAIIGALKGAKLVEEKNYLLRWIGPTFQATDFVKHA